MLGELPGVLHILPPHISAALAATTPRAMSGRSRAVCSVPLQVPYLIGVLEEILKPTFKGYGFAWPFGGLKTLHTTHGPGPARHRPVDAGAAHHTPAGLLDGPFVHDSWDISR
jgi:hypothetical protein